MPNEVALFNALYSVDPYVPKARICYVCYRAGHIGKDCKSTKPRCLYCGGDHDRSFECEGKRQPKKCINCGGEHLATSFDCLVIKQYKEAIKLAAYNNIPNIEARKIVMANRQGNTSNLSTNPRNFPYLSGSQRHSLDDFASYNRFSPLESADYNSPTFSSNSYAAMAASTSLPSPNASRRSHDSSKKNKSVSFRHNPFLRTDSSSESFERLLPPMDGQFSATPPAHPTLAFTHGNNGRMREDFSSSSSDVYPKSSSSSDAGAARGSDPGPSSASNTIRNIADMILSFMGKIKSLFNNSPFISAIVDPLAESVIKLVNLIEGFNLDFLINLITATGSSFSNVSTGNSEYSSRIHRQ
ncbi:hypothetical protein ALC62_13074 [Cyphomyrmex costatus]|uniref:CCHC-type domain-containing protein n=1 Tax=Cyphomyrmex costatus TaxID=456900 RepID=A0A151IAG8_9HYME|nr:hypothetical protein ALC62_13074 [Cyphomyrmex costatus]